MNADSSAANYLVEQLQSQNLLKDRTENAVRSIRIPAVT